MNSYKRLREGIVLSQNDQDPYAGVLFHETPLALKFFTFLFSLMRESCVNLVFIIGDLLTAFVLGKVAELIATNLLSKVFESNFEYLVACSNTLTPNTPLIHTLFTCSKLNMDDFSVPAGPLGYVD